MLPDRTRIAVENVPAREKWREVAGIGRYCNLRVVGIVKQFHGDLVGTVCHCGGERLLGATEARAFVATLPMWCRITTVPDLSG